MVVDEHGQLKGMVTLHDLTEAIVGDLPDEDEDTSTGDRETRRWLVARGRPGVDR
jgi:putative hemolysin